MLLPPDCLPVTLLISAGRNGINPAGEGDDGCEHFAQPVKKKVEMTSCLPDSSLTQNQESSKNKTGEVYDPAVGLLLQ